MSKRYTEEQRKAVGGHYGKGARTARKRIRAVCSISIFTAFFLVGAMAFVLVGSALDFSMADLAGFLIASSSCLALGVFGIVAARSDDSFRRMGGALRIAANVGIVMNALCMLAMLRGATLFAMIPIFAIFVLVAILSLTAAERNRLKNKGMEG